MSTTKGSHLQRGADPVSKRFNSLVERFTGCGIDAILDTPIEQWRIQVEKKHNNVSMSFPSKYPAIGRGNVLRNHTLSHAQIESDCQELWLK